MALFLIAQARFCASIKPLLLVTATTTRQQTPLAAKQKTQPNAQTLRSCCAKGSFTTTTNTKTKNLFAPVKTKKRKTVNFVFNKLIT